MSAPIEIVLSAIAWLRPRNTEVPSAVVIKGTVMFLSAYATGGVSEDFYEEVCSRHGTKLFDTMEAVANGSVKIN